MAAKDTYGIGYYLSGHFHILCYEGKEYRFRALKPDSEINPVELEFFTARRFIETHHICANISHHDIRIMPFGEIQELLTGGVSPHMAQLLHIGEEEEEEPLH